ncbi:MAG: cell division protein FtsL [Gammaproteobacteria bacterium]|nr:cell division protein FtsL [Gammaproteobacteria bacterium]
MARRSGLVILSMAVLISAMLVVHVRHQNRLAFVELKAVQDERDRLSVQWGQLLLEQGTWAVPQKVERLASQKLEMGMAPADRIVIVPLVQKSGQ